MEEVYVIGHTTKSADWLSLVTAPVLYRLKILGGRPFYDRLSLSFFLSTNSGIIYFSKHLELFLYKPHVLENRRTFGKVECFIRFRFSTTELANDI